MVRAALAEQPVREGLVRCTLHKFLQDGLVVAALLLSDLLALGVEQHAVNERACRADAAVEIHRGKHRLGRVSQNRRTRASAAALLAVAELEVLSQFQALQFEMADLKTRIEAARLLIYRAADMKDKHLNYGEAAAMAKLYAAETAMAVTTKCVQYHGGYGYTKDYPVERMMRDAKITEIYEGTSEVQRMVIAGKTFKK